MRKILVIALLAVVAIGLAAPAICQGLRLPAIFGDNMVLQSGKATPVWGWADPGGKVTVTLGSQTVSGIAGPDGKWKATLVNLKRSAVPTTVTVKSGKAITLRNVLIGDVWLGSGQSNMEMMMADITYAPQEIAAANYPNIRLFTVTPKIMKIIPVEDCAGKWVVCSPDTVKPFSATLFLFGREIYEKTKIPLGLIHSSLGGTRIELWTAPEGYAMVPEFAHYATSMQQAVENYKKMLPERLPAVAEWAKNAQKALETGAPLPVTPDWPEPGHPEGGAGVLYHGMISPVATYGIKGFVWYQGEWNGGENEIYTKRMEALVGGWRKVWGNQDLPFYYVQLARMPEKDHSPWNGSGLCPTREGQLKALSIPKTGMACIIDLEGSSGWHPGDKQDVGKRLSLWALRNEYGMKDVTPSGPLYKSMKIDGSKIVVSFDYAEKGLILGKKKDVAPFQKIENGTVGSIAIAGEDKNWVPATAVIQGKTIVVSSPEVARPVAVRYGYTNDPDECNLYNTDELPTSPFRTDNW